MAETSQFAGKPLYRNGSNCQIGGYEAVKFQGPKMHCEPCTQRDQCLRHPERTATRQVVFLQGSNQASEAKLPDKNAAEDRTT